VKRDSSQCIRSAQRSGSQRERTREFVVVWHVGVNVASGCDRDEVCTAREDKYPGDIPLTSILYSSFIYYYL
jgi:hypothetical protein